MIFKVIITMKYVKLVHPKTFRSIISSRLETSFPFSSSVLRVRGHDIPFPSHLVLLPQHPFSALAFLVYFLLFPRSMPVRNANLQQNPKKHNNDISIVAIMVAAETKATTSHVLNLVNHLFISFSGKALNRIGQ